MGVLKSKNSYKYLLVAIFYIIVNSCANEKPQGHFSIDKSTPAYIDKNLEDSSLWSFGFHQFSTSSKNILLAYLKEPNTIRIIDTKDSNKFIDKNFEGEALAIYTYQNTVSIIFKDKFLKYEFIKDIGDCIATITPSEIITNDTIIYFPYIFSGVVPISEDSILIPYRMAEKEINPVDTTSYLLLNKLQNKWRLVKKIANYPDFYNHYKEYLILPLSSYNSNSNSLFYTFQKLPMLFKLNLTTNQTSKSNFYEMDTLAFNGKNCSNVGYIRKYVMDNDCNSKIFCCDSNVFVLVKKKADSKIKYSLIAFDYSLKILKTVNIEEDLLPDYSFILNNQLYVKNSKNYYSIFSYSNN